MGGDTDRGAGTHCAAGRVAGGARAGRALLGGAVWDADAVGDALRTRVVDHRGEETAGVLIIAATSFGKKGDQSCGGARHYTGTAGATANAPVAVCLVDAAHQGMAVIARAL